MKVAAFNGSPHAEGNSYFSLKTVAEVLEKEGIEVSIHQVGNLRLQGCLACGFCGQTRDAQCAINDALNPLLEHAFEADGILLASPVHFSGVGGTMKSFLDRMFYVSASNGNLLRHKVGASIAAVRRSGGVATFDELNHYLQFAEMFLPTANYWTVIHGRSPGEAQQDSEGVQSLQVLGANMAWLMKLIAHGKDAFPPPPQQAKTFLNFIR